MQERSLSFHLRGLAAVLTTPLIVGLVWGLLLAENRSAEDTLAAIGLCYIVWLLMGVPGLFSRSRAAKPAWTYPAIGAAIAVLFTFPFGAPSLAWPLTMAATGAAAGAWYWVCAYWRPGPLPGKRAENSLS
jgi:hypothetical protein